MAGGLNSLRQSGSAFGAAGLWHAWTRALPGSVGSFGGIYGRWEDVPFRVRVEFMAGGVEGCVNACPAGGSIEVLGSSKRGGRACVYACRKGELFLLILFSLERGGIGIEFGGGDEVGTDGVLVDVYATSFEVGTVRDEVIGVASLPDGEI